MMGFMRLRVRTLGIASGVMAAAVSLFAPLVFSSGTTAWEMNSYTDFVRGRFDGVSLSREGRLSDISPRLRNFPDETEGQLMRTRILLAALWGSWNKVPRIRAAIGTPRRLRV